MDSGRLTILVPCYNEEHSLPDFLKELIQYSKSNGHKIIIVDDGSTDGTSAILASADCENLEVITHKVNRGYGGALKTAICSAATELVVTLDADGQHCCEDIRILTDKMNATGADLVIGNRVSTDGSGAYRRSGKWIIRKLSRLLTDTKAEDINSGMKLYRTDLARRYLKLCPDSMAFSDVITLVFSAQKHLVLEAPVKIRQRTAGKSTIGISTAFETVLEILNIVMLFNPIRIFLPLSVIFILLGVAWGIPIILAGRGVSVGAALLILVGTIIFLLGLIAEQLSLIRKKF